MTEAPPSRGRPVLCLLIFTVILIGLASRRYPAMFPVLFGKYPGDALWAWMIFLVWALVSPGWRATKLAFLALATSYAVEFSQLYQAPWIDAIRRTTAGHLVLGSTFSWFDMLAYTVGITWGVLMDFAVTRSMGRIHLGMQT